MPLAELDPERTRPARGGGPWCLRVRPAVVTPDTGSAARSYDMNAPFMSLELHERGIHVVRPGAGGAGAAGVRSRARAMAGGGTQPDQDQPNLTGIEFQRHGCGMGAFLLEGGSRGEGVVLSGGHVGGRAGGACGAAVPPWPLRVAPVTTAM